MIHAFDFLTNPPTQPPDVVAVFGSDVTLRSWALHQVASDGDVMQVEGDATKWSDLKDELATASLFDFGESKRTIMVRGADPFLSEHRSRAREIRRQAWYGQPIRARAGLARGQHTALQGVGKGSAAGRLSRRVPTPNAE